MARLHLATHIAHASLSSWTCIAGRRRSSDRQHASIDHAVQHLLICARTVVQSPAKGAAKLQQVLHAVVHACGPIAHQRRLEGVAIDHAQGPHKKAARSDFTAAAAKTAPLHNTELISSSRSKLQARCSAE